MYNEAIAAAHAAARSDETQRPGVPAADGLLGRPFPLGPAMPAGTITFVDYMGTDRSIDDAARTSMQRSTRPVRDVAGLIDFLVAHNHTTPLEVAKMRCLLFVPKFVADQLVRQRTANINVESFRMSTPSEERWVPPVDRLVTQHPFNKQGSGGPLDERQQATAFSVIERTNAMSRWAVDTLEGIGLAREVARSVVTVNTYTTMSFCLDAHNLGQLMTQRMTDHAQRETRAVVEAMSDFMSAWLPITHAALMNHRVAALRFSGDETEQARLLAIGAVTPGVLMAQRGRRFVVDLMAKMERIGLSISPARE